MALEQSMIAWPVRFAAATLGLRFEPNGGAAVTLNLSATVGRNYWMVGDAQADADGGVGGVGDALKVLENGLNTNGAGITFTVSLTAGFGVKIDAAGGTYRILWGDGATHPTLPGIFGFTATTQPGSSGTTSTGTAFPQGLWRPSKPLWTDTRDREPTVAGINVALDGSVRVASLVDHPKRERHVAWLRVDQALALIEYQAGTAPTSSFEYAWINSMKLGRPLRLYTDETVRNTTSYGLYRVAKFETDPLDRVNPSISNTRWNVGPLPLRKV